MHCLFASSFLPDSVVVQEEGLDPGEEGEVVELPHLVVREVDAVELVQGRAQVLHQGNLVPWNN